MLEVKSALRDWLGRNNMSGQVFLEGFTVSELDVCSVQTRHMFSFGRHLGEGNMTLRIVRAKRQDERVDGGGKVYHSTLDGGNGRDLIGKTPLGRNRRNTRLCKFS
jgi:hypothetical protein